MDPHSTSDNAPISLHEHLLRKPWFLRIESAGRKKILLVTTKTNLPEAREWIDDNLEPMIRRSIPPGVDPPPSSLLPRRLDKPVYSATSQSYADILKKQFSLAPNATTDTADHNRPPRKRQATKLDYDSDTSSDTPSLTTATTTMTGNSTASTIRQPSPTSAL